MRIADTNNLFSIFVAGCIDFTGLQSSHRDDNIPRLSGNSCSFEVYSSCITLFSKGAEHALFNNRIRKRFNLFKLCCSVCIGEVKLFLSQLRGLLGQELRSQCSLLFVPYTFLFDDVDQTFMLNTFVISPVILVSDGGTKSLKTLTGMGYTELVYELENADLHIPLAALLAEIPLEETPEAEVISVIEGEIDESGEIGEDVEELEMDLAPQVLKVDAYDICIEQVEVAELTERETGILQSYEPKVPGYRVRVRAVIDGEEGETSLDMPVATTEEGETLVELPPADKLPEGTYPIGLVLRVLPMDEVYTEQVAGEDPEIDSIIIEHPDEEEEETYQLQGVDAVFISDIETPEDKDIVDVAPAVFHDIDGMLYAGYSVNADGIYCAGTALPEGMVSTFISSEPEGDGEELEDFSASPANTLSGIGTTFTLDENGNPVVEN